RVLGEPAPCYPHHNGGGRDGSPLDRLEWPGERQPLAVLHHHSIREDVAKGQAESHEGKVEGHLPIGIGVQTAEDASHHRRQTGGQQKIAPAPPAKQRHKVGEEPVHRLDQPGNDRNRKEIGGLAGTEVQRLFEQKGEREVRQVPHALGEVDHGKDERQPARFGVLPEAPEYRWKRHGESPAQEAVGHSHKTCAGGSGQANAHRYTQHHCGVGTTTRHRRDVCPVKACTASLSSFYLWRTTSHMPNWSSAAWKGMRSPTRSTTFPTGRPRWRTSFDRGYMPIRRRVLGLTWCCWTCVCR